MPPSLGDRIGHILVNIERIRSIVNGHGEAALEGDWAKRMILERALEIICEASRHIPAEAKVRATNIDWRRMSDLGNRLRHAYQNIQLDILLRICREDLPPLKAFVERILAEEQKR